ncbi:putative CoA-substrate-specific enzyme activase [Anaerosolibacter carboniphilus]|uniref:Putative CoA-substrate-specific enzyme activase n=1 Tax=Anaerosolibacter carboniphilus TaxID=1417629 RepID=A0A841KS28_9FIRM|nr:putative CoA-substrate-specific enzyme activase [Anaerosolibacter carboniphilus]
MRILGIDLGSRQVKVVLMESGMIVDQFKISTMSFYRDYCNFDGKLAVDLKKLGVGDIDRGISTGYGRNNTDLKLFQSINEIKAHAYGALYQSGLKEFILLDIGGQDVKVVKVEKGIITDLELNEKCAASCGRYLENMANVLEVTLEGMSNCYDEPVELNSTCAVFSESELIGKIAEGVALEKLCAGVNYSLYKRLQPLLTKFKGRKLVLSGGVAQSSAIQYYLKEDYDEIISLQDPQFNGAIGCCHYGNKMLKR